MFELFQLSHTMVTDGKDCSSACYNYSLKGCFLPIFIVPFSLVPQGDAIINVNLLSFILK